MGDLRRRLFLDTTAWKRGAEEARSTMATFFGWLRSATSSAARDTAAAAEKAAGGVGGTARKAEEHIRRLRTSAASAEAELKRIENRRTSGLISSRDADRAAEQVRATVRNLSKSITKELGGNVGDAVSRAMAEALQKVDTTLEKAERKTGGFFSRLKSGFGQLTGLVGGLVGGSILAGITAGMVRLNATMEQTKAAFATMLDGSSERADVLLQKITRLGAETPYELNELANAARSLLAFGGDDKTVVDELRMLGDVASGIKQPVGEIAEIYGKIRVNQKVMGDDLNQLGGRGIPIITELARVLGVADTQVRQMVTDGKIGFPEIEKAFQRMTSEGGTFAGSMEAQSRTFLGLLSTASDFAQSLLRDVGAEVFLRMRDDLKVGVDALATTDLSDFTTRAGRSIAQFYDGVKTAAKVLYEYRGAIATALAVLVSYQVVARSVAVVEGVVATARTLGAAVAAGYRTATLLAAAAQALFTGNTLRAAAAVRLLDTATKTTVIGAIISVLVSAAAYMLLFADRTDTATEALERQSEAARDLARSLREATGARLASEYEAVRAARDDAQRTVEANERVAANLRARGLATTERTSNAGGTTQVATEAYANVTNAAVSARNNVRKLDAALADADRRIAADAEATMARARQRIEAIENDRTKTVAQRRAETEGLRTELVRLEREQAATRPDAAPGGSEAETTEQRTARLKAAREQAAAERKAAREQAAAGRAAVRDAAAEAREASDRLKAARKDLDDLLGTLATPASTMALRAAADALIPVQENARKARAALAELRAQPTKQTEGELEQAALVVRAAEAQQTALEVQMRRLSALPAALRRGEGDVLAGYASRLSTMATEMAEIEGALVVSRARFEQTVTDDLEARLERLGRQMEGTRSVGVFLAGLGEDVRARVASTMGDVVAELEQQTAKAARAQAAFAEAATQAATQAVDEVSAILGDAQMPELVVSVAADLASANAAVAELQNIITLAGSVGEDVAGKAGARYREAAEEVAAYAARVQGTEAAIARAQARGDTATAGRLEAGVAAMRDRLAALTVLRDALRSRALPDDVAAADLDIVVTSLQRAAEQRLVSVEAEVVAGTRTRESADDVARQISEELRQQLVALLEQFGPLVPEAALEPIRRLIQDIGKGYDPLRKSRLEAERIREALRGVASIAGQMLDLGRAVGVVSDELEALVGGAIAGMGAIDNLIETKQRLREKEKSGQSLTLGDDLAKAGAYLSVAVAGATMVAGFLKGIQAQREESRRLEAALREAASSFRQSTREAFRGGRVGSQLSPEALAEAIRIARELGEGKLQGQERASRYARLAELGLPGFDDLTKLRDDLRAKIRDNPFMRDKFAGWTDIFGSFDSAELNKAIDALLFGDGTYRGKFGTIDMKAMMGDMLGPGFEEFTAYLQRMQAQLGQATNDIAGAAERARFLGEYMGGDATAQLEAFLAGLGQIATLPSELQARLSTVRGLDLKTAEGRKALEAFYQSLAADLESGRLATGSLSREEIEALLNTLKGLSSGDGGSGADEYTRGVQVARSITELQGSEVILLLEEIAYTLRRMAEASGVALTSTAAAIVAGAVLPPPPLPLGPGKTIGRTEGVGSGGVEVTIGSVVMTGDLQQDDFERVADEVGQRLFERYQRERRRL